MYASLRMRLAVRPRASVFGPRESGEPRLGRSERSHETACYQELAAITATHREIAIKSLLIDFVHVKQAIRGALIEGGVLDVFSNDPRTLFVAAAKEIAAVMVVVMMMGVPVFVVLL